MENCRTKKGTILYDAGGWFLISVFFGVALVGVVFDYFWNYLVLSLTLRRQRIDIRRKTRHAYCLVITALGLLIDWLYYEICWGTLVIGSLRVPAVFSHSGQQLALELRTVLLPMVVLGGLHFGFSRYFLKLTTRQAVLFGLVMGVCTAPWLIVGYVLLGL